MHAPAGLGVGRPLWIGPGGSARQPGPAAKPRDTYDDCPQCRRSCRSSASRTRSWSTWCAIRRHGSTRHVEQSLIREWQVLVHRFIGSPWVVSIAPASSPLSNLDVDTLKPDAFASVGPFDKVWLIRIAHAETGSGLVFKGREYDTTTRGLGTLQRPVGPRRCADVARELLQFTQGLFNPTALIVGQEGGRALLTVRGASIAPATPVGAVVATGAVFLPLRLISARDGKTQINRIPFTYLRVETVDGPVARCAIVSPLSDPLTLRMSRPFTMAAVGSESLEIVR